QVALRGRLARCQLTLERAVEHVVYERALAGSAHTGDDRQCTDRYLDVHSLQIVLARAGKTNARTVERAPLAHARAAVASREVAAGGSLRLQQCVVAALVDDGTTALAAARPQLDDMVRDTDRRRIMFHDEHTVAARAQLLQQPKQAVAVARMQADRRFIEHVERVGQRGAERVRERDALRLAAREGARLTLQREIAETDVIEETESREQLAQDR